MMNLLLLYLGISISVGAFLLLLQLVSPLIAHRYTAKWKYWIGVAIAVRLLLPFNFSLLPGGAAVEPVIAVPAPIVTAAPQAPTTEIPPQAMPGSETSATGPVRQAPVKPAFSVWALLAYIWVAGGSLYLAYHLLGYYSIRKRVARWGKAAPEDFRTHVNRQAAAMGIRRQVECIVSDSVPTPMMLGFFKTCIVLPQRQYTASGLAYILRHELTHIKRNDQWYKLLLVAATALHWYNPVVHLFAKQANDDIELACDDAVLRQCGFDERMAYSETILDSITGQRARMSRLTTYFIPRPKSLKARFQNIMNHKEKKKGILTLAAVVVTVVLLGSITVLALGDGNPIEAGATSGDGYASPPPGVAEQMAVYAPFGLVYHADDKVLYYNGQRVRFFDDKYAVGEDGEAIVQRYLDVNGEIDVYAIRDFSQIEVGPDGGYDPSGVIVGIGVCSDAEFAARDVDTPFGDLDNTPVTAVNGEVLSDDELAALYSVYEPVGVHYDSGTGRFYYEGQLVRLFNDVLQLGEGYTDGRVPNGAIRFIHRVEGTIDIYIIRDYESLGADGYGEITGVGVYSPEEYERLTNGQSYSAVPMQTVTIRGEIYYLVDNEAHLRSIGTGEYGLDANYMQNADIQMSAREWVPIGTADAPFTGRYEGNGHEIVGLTMTSPTAQTVGFFGYADHAVFHNITLRGLNIESAGGPGKTVGAIVAWGGGSDSSDNQILE